MTEFQHEWAAPDDVLPEPSQPCAHWIERTRKAEAERDDWKRAYGEARGELIAARQRFRDERQMVLDAINLYGDETLHKALDAIGWPATKERDPMSGFRRPWRRCASCQGVCHWHDEAWVCDDCGDEWYPEHGKRYAAPTDRSGGIDPLLLASTEDAERVTTALRFYLEHAAWSSGDTERAEFVRLHAALGGRYDEAAKGGR